MAGTRWVLVVFEDDVIEAYRAVQTSVEHTDAMTEDELAAIRRRLFGPSAGSEPLMLSLHWLRNAIVRLRKAGKLAAAFKAAEPEARPMFGENGEGPEK